MKKRNERYIKKREETYRLTGSEDLRSNEEKKKNFNAEELAVR
jgi:hypothetical protein